MRACPLSCRETPRGRTAFSSNRRIRRSLFYNEQQAIETTNNIEQARLTVKTVDAAVEPIQAWSYGNGYVSAVVKKHLNFQAEGTVEQRKVEVEVESLSKKEIIEGVDPGEKLVTEGQNLLVNGAPVEIIP